MKKFIKAALMVCLSIIMMMPTMAFAADENVPEWEDLPLTQEEFDNIISPYEVNTENMRTSGLITIYGIALQRNGSNINIAGKTYCNADVVKCGFTVIKIERRISQYSSWTDYTTYEDLYNDSAAYFLSKTIYAPTGYQYRATCTHYAKKSLLSTEKINNTSNIV
ncbi:MAG: hypothetical protein K2L19_00640 [Eubacterium sp.]|nr:hypothetical protein [Eubacterium sp.]